jgi:aspartyl-tRNA(Asn)/glutamyl-tRNA(Gln) amidotransferase subunit B
MQEGSFRCDANVSVRPAGSSELGTRSEIKNLNSFRFIERAIEYEVRRQIEILEDGGRVVQETRLYDPDRDETRPMRSKEDAHDYRYFPDPDLLPLEITERWIAEIDGSMPELPRAKRESFTALGLSPYLAALLSTSREVAEYAGDAFGRAERSLVPDLANWITGALSARLNEENLDIAASRISPAQLLQLAARVADGTLSGKMAKEVFDAIWAGEGEADAIIAARGLRQISDSGELERLADQVIAANPQQVTDYRSGKEKAFNSLVGQVMKASKGKANPQQVTAILKKKLEA